MPSPSLITGLTPTGEEAFPAAGAAAAAAGLGPFGLLAIGAGLGLIKSELDKPRQQAERQLRADLLRFTPFTKRPSPEIGPQPDPLGEVIKFGATGFAQGQAINAAGDKATFNKKLLDILEKQDTAAAAGVAASSPLSPVNRVNQRLIDEEDFGLGVPAQFNAFQRLQGR